MFCLLSCQRLIPHHDSGGLLDVIRRYKPLSTSKNRRRTSQVKRAASIRKDQESKSATVLERSSTRKQPVICSVGSFTGMWQQHATAQLIPILSLCKHGCSLEHSQNGLGGLVWRIYILTVDRLVLADSRIHAGIRHLRIHTQIRVFARTQLRGFADSRADSQGIHARTMIKSMLSVHPFAASWSRGFALPLGTSLDATLG